MWPARTLTHTCTHTRYRPTLTKHTSTQILLLVNSCHVLVVSPAIMWYGNSHLHASRQCLTANHGGVATAMQSGHRRCLGVPRAATPAGVRTTLLPQRDGQWRACSSGAVSHRSKPARQHRAGMLASGSRAVRRLHNGFNPLYINASFHFPRTHSKRRGLSKRDSAPE